MMQLQPGAVFNPPWMQVPYFAREGQALVDGVEHLRGEMERRWGVGRLRLVVEPELRLRFDRQDELLAMAVERGTIEDVRREAERMVRAWRALDGAARAVGASELSPLVWEVELEDGRVAALVRTTVEARHVAKEGRRLELWTLEEIARLIVAFPTVVKAKELWPGAEVVSARSRVPELPLDGDPIPQFGGG